MQLTDWIQPITTEGFWECEHNDQNGNPAPPTRLWITDILTVTPGTNDIQHDTAVVCPDCGTYWRVWPKLHKAKYYIASSWSVEDPISWSLPMRYRRSITKDIDRILALVMQELPNIVITQYRQSYPVDNDGLWVFRVFGFPDTIQIESGTGMLPFLVETEEQWGENARIATTIEATATMILDCLSPHV